MRVLEWLKQHRAGLITAIGYATLTVITISVFVYLTFPWQKLSEWIRYRMEQTLSVRIAVGDSRVRFPFRLVWKNVTITGARRPGQSRVTAEQISVRWPFTALLRRQMDLDIAVRALGGEIGGRLSARRMGVGMKYHFDGQGQGLDLAKLASGFQVSAGELSGKVQIGRLEHDWVNQDWMRGQGRLEIEATDVEQKTWELHFTRMTGTLTLKGGMSNLENISAQGPSLEFVGSGNLLLRPSLMDSLLNFNSRVTLHNPIGPLAMLSALASPDGHFDFALRGALRNPTPYVNGTAFSPIGNQLSGVSSIRGRERETAGLPPGQPPVEP